MSLVRVGSNSKFASGWDSAFGGKKKTKAGKPAKASKKKAASPKKKATKKKSKK